MATSTVAKTMAQCLSVVLVLLSLAAAQGAVEPSNSTLPTSESSSELVLRISVPNPIGKTSFTVAPLNVSIGMGLTGTALASISVTGDLEAINPSETGNLTDLIIAYISCDPNTETSNISPSETVQNAGDKRPRAILLYSLTSAECNITGAYSYSSIFTMISADDSQLLFRELQTTNSPTTTVSAMIQAAATNTSGTNDDNDGGPAPTTAVAMSILYSITGIITLLFLIIIATGAVRAHRHPERYGPRNLPGRPRQSRAKGLARAMLETLPIVKFGDPEPVKPGTRDIELESGSVHAAPETDAVPKPEETETTTRSQTDPAVIESGMGANTQAESTHSQEAVTAKTGGLGCSICTEDFTTGEDVRVLPCQHKYHPACIDPWLLNVSGTCPLCRHDLRPVMSHTSNPPEGAEGDELPPPLAENEDTEGIEASDHRRHRVSRFLDLNRLRHAPPHERIAALRHLREQSQSQPQPQPQAETETTEDVEERSRRARLTGRLRDTFRIRTRQQAAAE